MIGRNSILKFCIRGQGEKRGRRGKKPCYPPTMCAPAIDAAAAAAKTPEVVDLTGADSDSQTSHGLALDEPVPNGHGGRSTSSASSSSLWSCDHLQGSDEDEKDVVARLALEDWETVAGLVGPGKTLLDSALSRIIMPYHTPPRSRRGGRRGVNRRRATTA